MLRNVLMGFFLFSMVLLLGACSTNTVGNVKQVDAIDKLGAKARALHEGLR